MTSVLVTTLGASWQIVPELYGFTNPADLPLYRHAASARELERLRAAAGFAPVARIWVVTTAGTEAQRVALEAWQRALPRPPQLRIWWTADVADIGDEASNREVAELVHRVVLHACRRFGHGNVLLSLAGGRKTMSAEMQEAAHAFGCAALLHVADRLAGPAGARLRALSPEEMTRPLPRELADLVVPLLLRRDLPPSEAVRAELRPEERAHAIPEAGGAVRFHGRAALCDRLREIARRADALLANLRAEIIAAERAETFPILYTLPPARLRELRESRIGTDPARTDADLAWLRRLPKAELHCHLGGLFTPGEMIAIARSERDRVHRARRRAPDFDAELKRLAASLRRGDLEAVRAISGDDLRALRRRWRGVREPLGVAGFILAFEERPELLDAFLYGELRDPARFRAIGFARYERLGDLQGSGLLQSEATLEAAIACWARRLEAERIRYAELRCSPVNYTRGGLSERRVVEVLLHALAGVSCCDLRLIFIASRHRDPARARRTVALATRLRRADPRFAQRFVGFDLAGEESRMAPAAFRKLFRPLHEEVVRITIHAGEGEPADRIWQAVYELAADRIGHGLTLGAHPELLGRFLERSIAIEMCPSSNDQIVGFRDFLRGDTEGRIYPLSSYLEHGLLVTVNSDDPGISRTTLSREYLKAAAMTAGGLSRWQLLQLVYNGFAAAFCAREDRRAHIARAQRELLELLLPARAAGLDSGAGRG